jgi:hypothetical protein
MVSIQRVQLILGCVVALCYLAHISSSPKDFLQREERLSQVSVIASQMDPNIRLQPVKDGSLARKTMLVGQMDFLEFRNMCLDACRKSLAEENPSESSVHCRADTLAPRWLSYIHDCDLDPRRCEIRLMGCRGWILG